MTVIQMEPIIYVENKTTEDLENIYFTLDDYDKQDPRIKKIKSEQTKTTSIATRANLNKIILKNHHNAGLNRFNDDHKINCKTTILYLYHYDKNNEKRIYIVYDKLDYNDYSNIKVSICKINHDGSLNFNVILNYDPLKTH